MQNDEKIRCSRNSLQGSQTLGNERKAIDIADYSKGNGYSKGDLTDAGTPIILYGRLYTKYQFAISEVDTFAVPRNGAVYSQGNESHSPGIRGNRRGHCTSVSRCKNQGFCWVATLISSDHLIL